MIITSNTLWLLLRTELMKLKRTPAVWLTVSGAALLPCAYFIGFINHMDQMLTMTSNPWSYLFAKQWNMLAFLLLPLYAVLITSLVVQTEYKAKGWKHLLTQPVKRSTAFFSKLITILLLIICCCILFVILSLLAGVLLNWVYPGLKFFVYSPDYPGIFLTAAKSFISLLSIIAFQYWLSLRYKNFIIPVGIGMAGIILSGIIIHHWKYEDFYLYLQPSLSLIHRPESADTFHLIKAEKISLVYFFLLTLFGCMDFTRRKSY